MLIAQSYVFVIYSRGYQITTKVLLGLGCWTDIDCLEYGKYIQSARNTNLQLHQQSWRLLLPERLHLFLKTIIVVLIV
jgi:hypothetical protein